MNKYKTYEELKEELGDKFEEYMYKANIELLTKIDKAIDYITTEQLYTNYQWGKSQYAKILKDLLQILKGEDNGKDN